MFNRITLKSRAKTVLSLHYWPTFLALFLAGLITQVASFLILIPITPFFGLLGASPDSPELLIVLAALFLLMIIFSIALAVFIGGPLMVGVKRFLLDSSLENKADISSIFYAFKNGYKSIATASLMKTLILLGFGLLFGLIAYILLFVLISLSVLLFGTDVIQSGFVAPLIILIVYSSFIPLIIKAYSYHLTEYILAENPDMQWRDVLKKSKEMMRGNRWSTIVMRLSFIGWVLPAVLVYFIAVLASPFLAVPVISLCMLLIDPYIQATDTQLYLELSGKNEPETDSYTVDL